MANKLTPILSAQLADLVYNFRLENNINPLLLTEDFNRDFSINNQSIKGISGGFLNKILNRKTGFAFTAQGHSKAFKDHHIIAIRGTHFPSASDWLTNLNIGTSVGPKNIGVHSGFNTAFSSIKQEFGEYISTYKPKHLHCIGHSLGGALAQLTAIWGTDQDIKSTLYTFGAPRLTYGLFATRASAGIEEHRMVHGADPIPLVPLWPFAHTSGAYTLSMNEGGRLDFNAHKMAGESPGYIKTAQRFKSFEDMGQVYRPVDFKPTILRYEDRYQTNFSANSLDKITNALLTLLKAVGISLQMVISSGLTASGAVYDIIAKLLHGAIQLKNFAVEQLKGILGHILVFVGRGQEKVEELTEKFIRYVFQLMIKALFKVAKQAIKLLE